jgi:hypothetical protein
MLQQITDIMVMPQVKHIRSRKWYIRITEVGLEIKMGRRRLEKKEEMLQLVKS